MTDQISDLMAEAHAAPPEDAGRINVPPAVRDLMGRIRLRSASANRSLSGMWSTATAVETAKADLLHLAEDALAAHRLLR